MVHHVLTEGFLKKNSKMYSPAITLDINGDRKLNSSNFCMAIDVGLANNGVQPGD